MTTWLQWGCVSWRKTQTVIAGKGSILRQWQNMSIKADVILYKYKCVVSCTWQCGSYEVDEGKFSRTRRKEPARFSCWVFVDLWVGWWWSRTWRRWCRSSSSYFMFFFGFCNYVVAYVHDLIQRIIDEINTEWNELWCLRICFRLLHDSRATRMSDLQYK